MLAYKNDPALKLSVLDEMKGHRESDRLVKGRYWENGKGCAVGCLIKSSDHKLYEIKFGIPRVLALLEDRIFESLPNEEAMLWPERFLSAINTGADLSIVSSKLMYWLMTDPEMIRKYAKGYGNKALDIVSALYKKRLEGVEPTGSEWRAARDECWKIRSAAAAYADAYAYADADADAYADADADAYAAAAAYADADAYADAYAYAAAAAYAAAYADAAAAAYADADARKFYFVKLSDKLIEILKETVAKNDENEGAE